MLFLKEADLTDEIKHPVSQQRMLFLKEADLTDKIKHPVSQQRSISCPYTRGVYHGPIQTCRRLQVWQYEVRDDSR